MCIAILFAPSVCLMCWNSIKNYEKTKNHNKKKEWQNRKMQDVRNIKLSHENWKKKVYLFFDLVLAVNCMKWSITVKRSGSAYTLVTNNWQQNEEINIALWLLSKGNYTLATMNRFSFLFCILGKYMLWLPRIFDNLV